MSGYTPNQDVIMDMNVELEAGKTYCLSYEFVPTDKTVMNVPLPSINCEVFNVVVKEVEDDTKRI